MTQVKRDLFDNLAKVIRASWRSDIEHHLEDLTYSIADELEASCSNFDRTRFLKACGFDSGPDPVLKDNPEWFKDNDPVKHALRLTSKLKVIPLYPTPEDNDDDAA